MRYPYKLTVVVLWCGVAAPALAVVSKTESRRVVFAGQGGVLTAQGGPVYSVLGVAGVRITPRFSLGVGLGYDHLPATGYYGYPTYGVPLFLRARGYFLPGRVTPTVHGDAGVSLSSRRRYDPYRVAYDDGTANPIFDGGAGVAIRVGSRLEVLVDAGYRASWVKRTNYDFRSFVYLSGGVALAMERAY